MLREAVVCRFSDDVASAIQCLYSTIQGFDWYSFSKFHHAEYETVESTAST